jgi:predicted aspartyl protease
MRSQASSSSINDVTLESRHDVTTDSQRRYQPDFRNGPSVDTLFIGEISVTPANCIGWHETFNIQGQSITFKLDTGSEADIIPLQFFKKINATRTPPKCRLVSYSGHRITPVGETVLDINGLDANFQIIDNAQPILGRDTCDKLNLVKPNVYIRCLKSRISRTSSKV